MSIRNFILFCFVFVFSISVTWAQGQKNTLSGLDFDNQDPAMNEKYEKGGHLVYDCEGEYYVCTKKEEYEYCGVRRKKSLEELDVNLSCAPIKSYSSEKECHEHQQSLTSEGRAITFCTHPQEKFLR